MNDYAEAFKNRFSGFAISNEEIAVFFDVAQRTAETAKIYVAELFEALASLCRFIDDTFKAIQDTAESLAAIFEQVDALTLPPPLSRLQRLWRAQRRRAEREETRGRLKYLAFLYSMKRYKPP